jgi:hypothetical protein
MRGDVRRRRWADVAEWGEDNEAWLKGYLKLAHGTTSHDAFSRVFRVLDAHANETCFRDWTRGLIGLVEGGEAIDGQAVRGSKADRTRRCA